MEKTLNLGVFEALDKQEMMEVDGGGKKSKSAKKPSWKESIRAGLRMWVSGPMWYQSPFC